MQLIIDSTNFFFWGGGGGRYNIACSRAMQNVRILNMSYVSYQGLRAQFYLLKTLTNKYKLISLKFAICWPPFMLVNLKNILLLPVHFQLRRRRKRAFAEKNNFQLISLQCLSAKQARTGPYSYLPPCYWKRPLLPKIWEYHLNWLLSSMHILKKFFAPQRVRWMLNSCHKFTQNIQFILGWLWELYSRY